MKTSKFNGKNVKIVCYVKKSNRWKVRLLDHKKGDKYLAVREENLEPLKQGTETAVDDIDAIQKDNQIEVCNMHKLLWLLCLFIITSNKMSKYTYPYNMNHRMIKINQRIRINWFSKGDNSIHIIIGNLIIVIIMTKIYLTFDNKIEN